MLCSRLEDAARLTDPRYVAEPKLDGQRAQLHVRQGRTVHLYSRPGRELLRHPGMAWLQGIAWPLASAVLDGEAVAGDGHEGIYSVFEERNKTGGDLAFLAFDVLELDGRSVMREPGRTAASGWRICSRASASSASAWCPSWRMPTRSGRHGWAWGARVSC
jgi:ATP-dependent DNA ligase